MQDLGFDLGEQQASEQPVVAGGARGRVCFLPESLCAVEVAALVQDDGQLDLSRAPFGAFCRQELDRLAEQRGRGANVTAGARPPRTDEQMLGRAPGERERGVVERAKLDAVPIGLLEVVADELIRLD